MPSRLFALPRLFDLRAMLQHATTIWIGQLAVMAFAIADTLIAGRYATEALAALSVGTAIYFSVYIGLQGFIQSLLPLWARMHGARKLEELGFSVRQTVYIQAGCTLLGAMALLFPDPVLRLAGVPSTVQPLVRDYLAVQALTLPLALVARSFNTFSQSIGRPEWVTRLQAGGLMVKLPLSLWFTFGGLGLSPAGLVGCAWATFVTQALMAGVIGRLVSHHPHYLPYALWRRPERPHGPTLRAFVHLGLPGSVAIWVEVTSFTTMALLVAPMGTVASGAQQIASNMAAVLYMWPLSLAIAASTRVSYWRGARRHACSIAALRTGLWVAAGSAVMASALTLVFRSVIVHWYSDAPDVTRIAASLLIFVAAYHLADAMQTMGLFLLRCFEVVRTPAFIYTLLLWGIGLGAGHWLAYGVRSAGGMDLHSPDAFWMTTVVALSGVALLFMLLLRMQIRRTPALA